MKIHKLVLLSLISSFLLLSCNNANNPAKDSISEESVDSPEDYYKRMKSEVSAEDSAEYLGDGKTNENYNPNSPEASIPLIDQGQSFTLDSNISVHFDSRSETELEGNTPHDTLHVGDETFVRDLHAITENDVNNLRHNLEDIRDIKENPNTDGNCHGEACPVYAHINKKEQRLYLFVNGKPVDTFKTSTARSGYRTPDFDRKPDGRIYTRYSSHKYHGGNWHGLGNMPYAVFVEGGYAIHGATSGEIRQLGQPASHGCIRLHPRNAKLFNKLVRYAGVENTWVKVTEN